MTSETRLGARLAAVDERIADAVRQAGRRQEEVTRIVVTKGHPVALIRELAALGVRHVGESRHQEAEPKTAELADLGLTWHFVGQLQSNKARAVRRYVDWVHSVDRTALLRPFSDGDGDGPPLDCFIQVDLAGTSGRGGADPSALEPLAEALLATSGLRLRGVMGVPPIDEEPRSAFARLRAAGETVRRLEPAATAMSAGMSGDFVDAIMEGATHLRIGTAITGMRTAHG